MPSHHALHRLLTLPKDVRITQVDTDCGHTTPLQHLALCSIRRSACCPLCERPSTCVHSRYERTLADLPLGEYPLVLQLTVRRFFCRHPDCPRKVFAERFPDFTQPYARRTQRQRQRLERIGLALGGRAGARLAQKLGLPLCFKSLLRFVLASPCPDRSTPRVLGVDDWAFRKGKRYGTLLYDLETHEPVELLPDRTAESLSVWLKAHPGVEIISRDRASAYAEGAREGAPQAVQVADRFPLVKNLADALERLLHRKPHLLKQLAKQPLLPESAVAQQEVHPASLLAQEMPDKVSLKPLTRAERESQRRRLNRYLRYEQVRDLYSQGHNLSQIVALLEIDPKTVRKFLDAEMFPERSPRTGDSSPLDPYKAYLQQRWQEGCHNARLLWEELRSRGYRGGYTSVRTYLQSQRKSAPASHRTALSDETTCRKETVSLRDILTAFVRPQTARTSEETTLLERLGALWEPFRRFQESAQTFLALLRAPKTQDQSSALREWVQAAEASNIPELVSFAAGIKRDEAAVVAGLSLPWSNGAVEGSINRLKMIKRHMYGRAGFALLRRRVLEPVC